MREAHGPYPLDRPEMIDVPVHAQEGLMCEVVDGRIITRKSPV